MPDDHAWSSQFDTAADMLATVAVSCQRAGMSANLWGSVLLSHLAEMAVQSGIADSDIIAQLQVALDNCRASRALN